MTSQQSPPEEDRSSAQVAYHCQSLAERGCEKEFRCVSGRVLYEGHNRGGAPRRLLMRMGKVGHSWWSWRCWRSSMLELRRCETGLARQAQIALTACQIGQDHW